jgi:hypothetical protein
MPHRAKARALRLPCRLALTQRRLRSPARRDALLRR